MKDRGDNAALNVIAALQNENMEIVREAQHDTKPLSKWLYENQSEMRFGSENRLFLVLIDTDTPNFSNSWKLKRNIELLTPDIHKFLDGFIAKSPDDLKITFNYPGRTETFHSLAEIIFVVK
jgi:hypothetical protein